MMECDLGEILVLGQDGDLVADALAGDHTVYGGADSDALASAVTKDLCCLQVVPAVGRRAKGPRM